MRSLASVPVSISVVKFKLFALYMFPKAVIKDGELPGGPGAKMLAVAKPTA